MTSIHRCVYVSSIGIAMASHAHSAAAQEPQAPTGIPPASTAAPAPPPTEGVPAPPPATEPPPATQPPPASWTGAPPPQQGTPPAGAPPPPQQYAPPPPGYAYYPAPQPDGPVPPRGPILRYAPDRSVQTTPFLDATIGTIVLTDRYSGALVASAQFGTFIARRVRVAGRLGVFMTEADVEDYGIDGLPQGFEVTVEDDRPTVLGSASVGYAVVHGEGFAMSPSLSFVTSEVGAYGVGVGLALPFEWVSRAGMRIGFEIAGYRAMGGTVRAQCIGSFSSPVGEPLCDTGEVRDFDRPNSSGFYAAFQLGWGLSQPEPEVIQPP